MQSREPPEHVFVLRLRPRALRRFVFQCIGACVSYVLAKANGFKASFFDFSKSYWEPDFSYGFGMTSSCYNTCDLTKSRKLHDIQFCLIFPLYFYNFMLA